VVDALLQQGTASFSAICWLGKRSAELLHVWSLPWLDYLQADGLTSLYHRTNTSEQFTPKTFGHCSKKKTQ
jgi:hypothetical protein